MTKRSLLIGISIVVAVCVAVPAYGQSPGGLIRKALSLSKKAEKRSKRADKRSRVTLTLSTSGAMSLRCRRNNVTPGSGSPAVARETKIIAIQLDSATRTAVTG